MDERFLNRWCVAVTLSVIIILSVTARSDAKSQTITQQSIHKIELQQGWSYHWGDLEQDEQGQPIETSTAAVWEAYRTDVLTLRDKHIYLWLKRTLGPDHVPNAAIFLPHFSSYLAFEVYVDHTLIYRTGEFSLSFSNRHHPILWHLIPLPANYAGKTIFFRFYSDHPRYIGFLSDIWVGERNALMNRFVISDIDVTLLSLLFIIIGGFGYVFFIKIYHTKNTQLFSFATMSLCSGIYYLTAECTITQIFFAHPVVLSFLRFSMFFLFIGSFWLFFDLTTGIGPKVLYRFMWRLHLVFVVSVVPLGALKSEILETLFNLSMISASIGILYVEIQLVKTAVQGNTEGRILSIAFGVFGVAGILDMLAGLYIVEQNHLFYPWGLLVLLVLLAYLFILRYQAEMSTLQAEVGRSVHLASLGVLAAGIAHEINQPLTRIAIGVESLQLKILDHQPVSNDYLEKKCQIISHSVDRIKQIIEHVRIFSRDQRSICSEQVNVNETVRDALSLIQTQYTNHNITITTELLADGFISGNPYKLEQVILNLLLNAKDALEEKYQTLETLLQPKTITIKTYSIDDQTHIQIKDNGIGMTPEVVEHLFDPFFTTKDPSRGTGLGLSVSYGIVRDMHGDISVTSKVNEGTMITIFLPKIH